jgi:hypothetical protein
MPAQGLFSPPSSPLKERRVPSQATSKEDAMRRIVLLLSMLAAVAVTGAAIAQDGKVQRFAQDETLGFYRGATVAYLDFGPVKLRAGNKVAPIWAFTNGAAGQYNVIDTVPGRADYTPLWGVRLVTWKGGQAARVLRSAAAIRRATAAGQVTVKAMPIVVNCPVL